VSRSKIVPLIAATAVLLAACGGGKGGDKVAAGDYARDVCTAFTDWRDAIQKHQTELKNGLEPGITPAEGKKALAGFLGNVVDRSDALVKDVEDAGVPDAENGQKVADALQGAAKQARDKLAEAEGNVKDLPTGSRQAFDKAANAFGADIKTALGSVGDGLQDMNSPAVEKAFNDESACNG
jgi:hypothetical protein